MVGKNLLFPEATEGQGHEVYIASAPSHGDLKSLISLENLSVVSVTCLYTSTDTVL